MTNLDLTLEEAFTEQVKILFDVAVCNLASGMAPKEVGEKMSLGLTLTQQALDLARQVVATHRDSRKG